MGSIPFVVIGISAFISLWHVLAPHAHNLVKPCIWPRRYADSAPSRLTQILRKPGDLGIFYKYIIHGVYYSDLSSYSLGIDVSLA